MSSLGSEAGSEGSITSRIGEIVKTGYLKKLKTMKKKFFVLRVDSPNFPACLEYYNSGKKWKNKHPPKRTIILKDCFNVNRRTDTKHRYVIGLFSGIECFGIVLECEDDLQEWLRLLLMYQQGEDLADSASLKPHYEHVWKVTIQKKELANKHNLNGDYLICLTDFTLCLVKPVPGEEKEEKSYEFSLQSIRRCGNLDNFFYMELGQACCLGSGNLWMQADDSNAAHHMHSVIMNACTNCPKKETVPKLRNRSSSANESSKPLYFGRTTKWHSSGDDGLSALSNSKFQCHQESSIMNLNSGGNSVSSVGDGVHHCHNNLTSVPYSPYPPTRRASTGTRPVTIGLALLSSGRISKPCTGRERCDSLPTRPRMVLDTFSNSRSGNTAPYSTAASGRPASMYNRCAFSPSGCSHPTSPISATYSTDSAGSSLSVDADSENWSEGCPLRKVIFEENSEEYMQWGGDQNKNFLAENTSQNNLNMCKKVKSISHHSSSNSQSSCSTCSCSPMDASTYIPMSPIESVSESRTKQLLNRSCDSMNHSRDSSIHEELGEGYVPMAPLSVDAGYISMDQSGRKQGDVSPGSSSCSITSGTPSTDCKFSEFHLDKVASYLTPSDDDIIFNVRPTRAYSTGSKPDSNHHKCASCDSQGMRTRAFSVGSRCGSNLPTTPRRTPNSTSVSSIEPFDDMMEIDFSANKLRRTHLISRVKHHQSNKAVHTSAEKLTVPHSTAMLANLTVSDGYIDMSPKSSPKIERFNETRVSDANLSPPRHNKHVTGRSPAPSLKQTFARGSPGTNPSGALEKVVESESQTFKSYPGDGSSYMDMKPGICDVADSSGKFSSPTITTASNLHARKEGFIIADLATVRCCQTSCSILPHIKQPLLDTDGKQFKSNFNESKCEKSPPDGYVDMSFKGRRNENQQQIPKLVAKIGDKTPDGYIDMSFKNSRKNLVDSNSEARKPETRTLQCCSGKENQSEERQCSKPIAIQQVKNKRSNGSSFFRRYKSEETQPSKPNFLPIGLNIPATFASLGRKKKCYQKKEKCESPISNTSTIFPLSPDRAPSLDYDPNSKCAITASGESIRLTADYQVRPQDQVDTLVGGKSKCEVCAGSASGNVDEGCDYMVMMPGVVPSLQRKVSEPSCVSYSLSRTTNGKEETSMVGSRILHRSTSVPTTMAGVDSWRRSRSDPESGNGDVVCASEGAANGRLMQQSMDVDETNDSSGVSSSHAIVPKGSPCTDGLLSSEKVTYVSLDIPSFEEVSTKKEAVSSVSLSGLTYAQIEFDKNSCSLSSE